MPGHEHHMTGLHFFTEKKAWQKFVPRQILEGVKAVTIDQIGIEVHERYAKDQEALDSSYIREAAPHSEVVGTSSIFASEWEKLFEASLCQHPWAVFVLPPNLASLKRRRFFSFSLVPSLDGFSQDEKEGEKQQEEGEEKDQAFAEEKKRLMSVKIGHPSLASLERERSILFNLFASIEELNDLLREIHCRKLQYQKG